MERRFCRKDKDEIVVTENRNTRYRVTVEIERLKTQDIVLCIFTCYAEYKNFNYYREKI